MIKLRMLVGTAWTLLVVLRQVTGLCNFVDLVASCDMVLGGVSVTAYARVNHCHNPVDVTFQVLGKDPKEMSWRYTYVTTNLAENVVLSQHIILAMMATQKEDGRRISIEARFLLDGTVDPELEFLNTDLTLPIPQKNCVALPGNVGEPGWIAGACLLGLAVASIVVTLAVLKARTGVRIPGDRIPVRLWRRFAQHRTNTGSTVVQYVVPADTPADLKVYVSTADGLQPVHNNNKAELQLIPANLLKQTTQLNTGVKDNIKDVDNEPAAMGGIANTAFQWDDEEQQNNSSCSQVKDNENSVVIDNEFTNTGAKPKLKS